MFGVSRRRRGSTCARDGIISWSICAILLGCGAGHGVARGAAPPPRLALEPPALAPDDARGPGSPLLDRGTLRRSELVRAVLARNPSLASGRQAVRAAAARAGQSGAFEDPMLELGLAPLSLAPSRAPVGYEVTISQRLPWFGKRGLETSAASADAEAAKADWEAMRRDLALAAVVLYDQYYVSARSLEINGQHLELLRAMRDAATAQFESGHAAAQDPIQAEAELAHLEHDSVKLAAQRDVIVAQMNELLHRAPELPLPPPPRDLPAPSAAEQAPVPQLERQALESSAELEAARLRIRAEQARADRAGREAYPDLTLSASYNSMWDMPEHRFMLGLGFSLPLQGGPRAARADEALAMRAQFASELERLSDATRTRVFVAAKQLQESEHVLRLFETRLVPLARARIEAAQAGFITSRAPFAAVIDAEKSLRAVELELETSRAECYRRRAELERALGRIPGLDSKEHGR
jgi:outer membrane protein, heavy metal efflux system